MPVHQVNANEPTRAEALSVSCVILSANQSGQSEDFMRGQRADLCVKEVFEFQNCLPLSAPPLWIFVRRFGALWNVVFFTRKTWQRGEERTGRIDDKHPYCRNPQHHQLLVASVDFVANFVAPL